MFTRSHLQEMKRRYASMYVSPVEEEIEEHCGVCGEQGIEEVEMDEHKGTKPHKHPHEPDEFPGEDPNAPAEEEEVEVAESFELQATMALDDVGIKSKWKKGKLYVAKKDIKKAEKALGKSFKKMKKGAEPDLYYEEHTQVKEVVGGGIMSPERKADLDARDAARAGAEKKKKGNIKKYGADAMAKADARKKELRQNSAWALKYYDDKGHAPYGWKVKKQEKGYKGSTDLVRKSKREMEEQQIDEKGTAFPATVDTLRKIVKDKQHQTVMFKSGQALVDLFTASAIIAVYDGMKKPELKKKLEDMIKTKEGFLRTQSFAMKMVK